MTNTSLTKSPFFSIIIPVYNTEKYLRECLDSVLNQSFTDWEAICVDDGSKDHSLNILEEYARCDSRIRVFHQENGGASIARNYGLSQVTGVYFTFLDSDDLFFPWTLKYWNDSIIETDCDILSEELLGGFDDRNELAFKTEHKAPHWF